MDTFLSIINNPFVSSIIATIIATPILKYLYDKFNKTKIKNANNLIVESMVNYLITFDEYEEKVLKAYISSVSKEKAIKESKLYTIEEFKKLIFVSMNKSTILSNEEKSNLKNELLSSPRLSLQKIKVNTSIKNHEEKENSRQFFVKVMLGLYIYLVIVSTFIAFIFSTEGHSRYGFLNEFTTIEGTSIYSTILGIVSSLLIILYLIVRVYIAITNKKNEK